MKKIFGILALALILSVTGVFALGNPLGTTLYSVAYNQYPTTGVYFSEILRYSDLSSTDSTIKILYIAEAVELGTGGILNATVTIQKSNTSVTNQTIYSKSYSYDFETNPLSFYVDLNKGDSALVTFWNVSSNMTRIQVVRDLNAPRVTVTSISWLDKFADGFARVFEFESNFIDSLSTPAYIGFMVLEIIILPTLFVLLLAWSFKKVREAFLK